MRSAAAIAVLLGLLVGAAVALTRCDAEPAEPAPDVGVPPVDAGRDAPLGDAPAAPLAAPEPVGEPAAPALVGPEASSLEAAIEPDAPGTVTVIAQHEHHRDLFVLVAIDRSGEAPIDQRVTEEPDAEGGEIGVGHERFADEDEAGDDEGLSDDEAAAEDEPCVEEEDDDDQHCDCMRATGTTVDRGWRIALGQPVVRFELVRVRASDDVFQVAARRELTGPLLLDAAWADPAEVRVVDLDDDGRVEATAIFSFVVPDCDTFDEVVGTLGIIVDGVDLHEEAAFTRNFVRSGGDSDVNGETRETVWRVMEDDAGRPELRVRETWHTTASDPPDYDTREAGGDRAVVCPYDAASDRFDCPEPIGTALLELARPASP